MSSGLASFIEFYARGHGGKYEWWMIPSAVLINYGVVQMLKEATILELAIIFGLIGGTLRVIYTLILNDHVAPGAWAGYGLIILATILKTVWR